MKPEVQISFPPFHLDPNGQLWRGERQVPLRPKTVAVLHYLVEHAGHVVTREELLHAVWPKAYGAEGLPKECIHELRAVLGDKAAAPQFIETVGRRQGYRFIAPLTTTPPVSSTKFQVPSFRATDNSQQRGTLNLEGGTPLVGRKTELAHLHGWLAQALEGQRQVVFVTGEPGIGKTTVVDAFVAQVGAGSHACPPSGHLQGGAPTARQSELWIGRGQCVEHYGAGEAYLPVLSALGQMCRESGGEHLIALLRQYAPTWLAQMPALITETELEAIQRKGAGATRERMLRELAEALEALTAEQPLVLVVEDLQWSDYSTLDLLSVLAQRREPARLLLLGTYRPAEVIVREHPLKAVKQELQVHGQCAEVALRPLTAEAVTEYVAARFAVEATHTSPLRRLARVIHRRTEGNPLFMVNVVQDLMARGVIAQHKGQWEVKREAEAVVIAVPETLRQMIERQIERLSPEEQQILEVASVVGMEFSATAVAAGVEKVVEEIEKRCERLVRREQVLQRRGTAEWPDGTVAGRYGFGHALYHEVLHERITGGRRVELHRRIGERVEAAYGQRANEIAVELAVHFEQGRDYQKAVQYHQQAAETGLRRSGHQEAINHLTKERELLALVPDTPERLPQELKLQVHLGLAWMRTKGFAAPEAQQAYDRAREICQQMGETPRLFPVLRGLWAFHTMRAEHQRARELEAQLLRLAERAQDPVLLASVQHQSGATSLFLGELVAARAPLEQSLAFYDAP